MIAETPAPTVHPMTRITGLGVSGGIAIGRAVVVETRRTDVYRIPLPEEGADAEVARFDEAIEQAQGDVSRLRDRAHDDLGDQLGAIFDAHLLVLVDPGFLGRCRQRIREEHVNAEWAVHRTATEYAERFAAIEDPYLRERAADLEDVVGHLLRRLQGLDHHELAEVSGPIVIIADDLTPSEAVRLGRERVVGFAIETGGRTSHTTIIARSLRIPAVSGLGEVTSLVTDDDLVIIDGESGALILHPTPEIMREFEQRQRDLTAREVELRATCELPARTLDGVDVNLMANIDLAEEIAETVSLGAAGIGLYRSEFLYIEKSPVLPTEEDHLEVYRRIVEAAAPHPAIIRTYDLGGRKLAQQMLDSREENPVLGLRGIRLTLARPQVFRTQLRGLLRAAAFGDLWIMIPLVSTLDEVRRFRGLIDELSAELAAEGQPVRPGVKIGIMIEVPSAVMIADVLAREVDFFSIGTNDLIQYSLAVDRNNEHVADLYQPLHPAILRMLKIVIDSGRDAGLEVSLCGEMAADVRYVPMLLGLGMRRLSVAPRLLPLVKRRLRELSATTCAELAQRALLLGTASEVEELLASALPAAPA